VIGRDRRRKHVYHRVMRLPWPMLLVACAGAPAPEPHAPRPAPADLALLYPVGDPEPVFVRTGEPAYLAPDGPPLDAPGDNLWMAGGRKHTVARADARVRVLADFDRVRVLVWVDADAVTPWDQRPRMYESFGDAPDAPVLLPADDLPLPTHVCLFAAPDGALVGVTTDAVTLAGVPERDDWMRLAVPTEWGDLPLYAHRADATWQLCPPTGPRR
jgi:hypothetical protein